MNKQQSKIIENDVVYAKTTLEERGIVSPMFVLHGKEEVIPILAQLGDEESKEKVSKLVRTMIKSHEIEFYTFISESWYYKANKLEGALPPSKHPDRKECLVISGFRKDGEQKMIMLPFERKEKKIIFEERVETDNAESRFNFFEKNKFIEFVKKKAKEENVPIPSNADGVIKKVFREMVKKDVVEGRRTVEEGNRILKEID